MSEKKKTPDIIKSPVEEIFVCDSRPDFDRACENAYRRALFIWKIDDCGHSKRLPDFPRGYSSVRVAFVGYECSGGLGGLDHVYTFKTWMERREIEGEGAG